MKKGIVFLSAITMLLFACHTSVLRGLTRGKKYRGTIVKETKSLGTTECYQVKVGRTKAVGCLDHGAYKMDKKGELLMPKPGDRVEVRSQGRNNMGKSFVHILKY